ncbi:NmrA-like protein [Grosmannia clavigera kw1407]|uniref:NmrA-like protein n=1 Tax=Grosmannia clavigera (strain kw1407 / UAMH 11150) TaxID=655863 RepID=F0XJL5_GROCL|nr:NmrA-like protein [Grosmannia clavigera kw1407]EFX02067.1 NmrA-like protein [Grosmannia clavigera kw1407]
MSPSCVLISDNLCLLRFFVRTDVFGNSRIAFVVLAKHAILAAFEAVPQYEMLWMWYLAFPTVPPVFPTNAPQPRLGKKLFPSSTMGIKNVAVAGGTGNIGTPIVEEFVKAGFTVTLLSRDSKQPLPEGVKAIKAVDYSSVDSLKAALNGQDAVVSTLGSLALGNQSPLIDAAIAVGVKRFIPSEFGINTRKARDTPIGKIIAAKVSTVDYLIKKADASKGVFTWTGIATGLFFDWGLDHGFGGFDAKTKAASIYDSGNEKSQSSNVHFVGRAVAAVLKQAGEHFGTAGDKTANQYIEVASFSPSQNDVLKIVEAETGAKWTITHTKTADLQKLGEEKLTKGDFSAFGELLLVWQFKDGAGHAPDPKTSGNALLGLDGDDLKETLKSWIARSQ